MTSNIDIQYAHTEKGANDPDDDTFRRWISACLPAERRQCSVCVRIVDEDESRSLNHVYRQKDAPTNVLSFPYDLAPEVELDLLGDIVICAAVVEREATDAQRELRAHWAHLTVHGTLHLLGYDHTRDDDAVRMEALEVEILSELGYPNPYETRPFEQQTISM